MIHRLLIKTIAPTAAIVLCTALLAPNSAVAQTSAPAATKPAAKAGDGPAPEKLFERAIDAMGGKKAFEDLKSMYVEAEMTQMGQAMKLTLSRKGEDKWYMVQFLPQGMGEMKAGSNGEVTWMHHPMAGYRVMQGPEKDQMAEMTRIVRHDMIEYVKEESESMTTTGAAMFDDEEAWEIEVVDDEGQTSQLYFSQDNGRILGVKATTETQMGPTEMKITFGEWKEFGPFTLYTRMDVDQGMGEMSVVFNKIEVDKVEDSVFELPQEVKDMSKPSTEPASQPGG